MSLENFKHSSSNMLSDLQAILDTVLTSEACDKMTPEQQAEVNKALKIKIDQDGL